MNSLPCTICLLLSLSRYPHPNVPSFPLWHERYLSIHRRFRCVKDVSHALVDVDTITSEKPLRWVWLCMCECRSVDIIIVLQTLSIYIYIEPNCGYYHWGPLASALVDFATKDEDKIGSIECVSECARERESTCAAAYSCLLCWYCWFTAKYFMVVATHS